MPKGPAWGEHCLPIRRAGNKHCPRIDTTDGHYKEYFAHMRIGR